MRWMLLGVVAAVVSCGPAHHKGDGGADDDDDVDPYQDAPCPTSVTGKVFTPDGKLPLYGINVYAPIDDPPPFPAGVQCGQCSGGSLPGGAYTSAVTDATGAFTLEGVPPGANVPIIVTSGKWRRKVILDQVPACATTPFPDGTFRLPKNHAEGELPKIAVVTGGCDPLACILAKIGIDPAEFGTDSNGPKAVTFYNGYLGTAPGSPKDATALWGDLNEMKKFDIVINSCDCEEHPGNKTNPDLLRQYADIGGRVFGSHFQYIWTKTLIPQWTPTASWTAGSTQTPDLVDTSFGGGQALAQWLLAVGASTTLGQVPLSVKTNNAGAVNAPTKRWLYASGPAPATTHYLSFQTPVGVPEAMQCGKVVYAGMHVSAGDVGTTFPQACSTTFSPDEKALVFLLFDLSNCLGSIF